ncbi:PEP-CTERM sorting domain-containing protein [Haloferula sp.]|uniref:PEP-CTERM sorting domain-containing protein n=1 Tax=Haloferula sp. TaxID=2497595 RepID=UPI003C70C5E9
MKMTSNLISPRVLVLSASLALPLISGAATIFGDPADATVRADGVVQNDTSTELIVGQTFGAAERSSVFVFQIPNFGAVADPFTATSFDVNYFSTTNIDGSEPYAVDVYALGNRASSEVLPGDYYTGPYNGDATDATGLQAALVTPASALGLYSTDSAANATLLTYLNAAYDGGTGAGTFAFIRLSLQTEVDTNERMNFTAIEGSIAATDPSIAPQITYTSPFPIVPEPSAPLMLGASALLFVFRRRNR